MSSSLARVCSILLLVCLLPASGESQTAATRVKTVTGGSREPYWTLVEQFVDKTAHLACAQRMKELHGSEFTERQQEEYTAILAEYSDYLNRLSKSDFVTREQFWSDTQAYAERMIGGSGVPIPGRPSARYSVTTGSAEQDRELCARVAGEIELAKSKISGASLVARTGK